MSNVRNLLVGALALTGLSGAPGASGNAISVIAPYKHHGQWVFDDPARGLRQEPFVAGADTWMDRATANIPDAEKGFVLVFSGEPFPGHQAKFERDRPEVSGTWYRTTPPWPPMQGWLCPALFKYFKEAPPALYVKAEPLRA